MVVKYSVTHRRVEEMAEMIHVTQTTITATIFFTLFANRNVPVRIGRAICPAATWKNSQAANSEDASEPICSSVTPGKSSDSEG